MGERFGLWTVIAQPGGRKWTCQCACGRTKQVDQFSLKNGASCGCGCVRSRKTAARNHTHGLSKSKEYSIWNGMKQRCCNPACRAYRHYGGRGIEMVPAWKDDAETFIRDMGPCPAGHTIERINNDGPYSPDNCRWATILEQAQNRRNCHYVAHRGERQTLTTWAKRLGAGPQLIVQRMNRNKWSAARAIDTPRDTILRPITHAGHTMSLADWERLTGIGRRTIAARIDLHGWSVDRALTTPPRPKAR